eukprot:108130-Pleurochrysis_carterae.AAC.1
MEQTSVLHILDEITEGADVVAVMNRRKESGGGGRLKILGLDLGKIQPSFRREIQQAARTGTLIRPHTQP